MISILLLLMCQMLKRWVEVQLLQWVYRVMWLL